MQDIYAKSSPISMGHVDDYNNVELSLPDAYTYYQVVPGSNGDIVRAYKGWKDWDTLGSLSDGQAFVTGPQFTVGSRDLQNPEGHTLYYKEGSSVYRLRNLRAVHTPFGKTVYATTIAKLTPESAEQELKDLSYDAIGDPIPAWFKNYATGTPSKSPAVTELTRPTRRPEAPRQLQPPSANSAPRVPTKKHRDEINTHVASVTGGTTRRGENTTMNLTGPSLSYSSALTRSAGRALVLERQRLVHATNGNPGGRRSSSVKLKGSRTVNLERQFRTPRSRASSAASSRKKNNRRPSVNSRLTRTLRTLRPSATSGIIHPYLSSARFSKAAFDLHTAAALLDTRDLVPYACASNRNVMQYVQIPVISTTTISIPTGNICMIANDWSQVFTPNGSDLRPIVYGIAPPATPINAFAMGSIGGPTLPNSLSSVLGTSAAGQKEYFTCVKGHMSVNIERTNLTLACPKVQVLCGANMGLTTGLYQSNGISNFDVTADSRFLVPQNVNSAITAGEYGDIYEPPVQALSAVAFHQLPATLIGTQTYWTNGHTNPGPGVFTEYQPFSDINPNGRYMVPVIKINNDTGATINAVVRTSHVYLYPIRPQDVNFHRDYACDELEFAGVDDSIVKWSSVGASAMNVNNGGDGLAEALSRALSTALAAPSHQIRTASRKIGSTLARMPLSKRADHALSSYVNRGTSAITRNHIRDDGVVRSLIQPAGEEATRAAVGDNPPTMAQTIYGAGQNAFAAFREANRASNGALGRLAMRGATSLVAPLLSATTRRLTAPRALGYELE